MNSRQAINLLKGLEQSLDDYYELNDEGKAAFRMAITALELFGNAEQLPSAQPEIRTQMSSANCISRQAAIDIERNATVDTNPSHFEAHQKFTQFMDDAEVSSFGRWQWSNGFNTALTAVGIDLKKLPSAQPERKKGCKIVKSTGHYGYCACDQCGKPVHPEDLFCSKCGADFREEDA